VACSKHAIRPVAAAPGETQGLEISTPGGNFTFNNANLTYDAAESDCRAQGGHLASYNTLFEQQDVEDFLINNVRPQCGGVPSAQCPAPSAHRLEVANRRAARCTQGVPDLACRAPCRAS
jgi:hypothetical protein